MGFSILKDREHLIVPWLLLIIYFALPNRYAMYDAIRFAQAVEAGNFRAYPFWHPSHVLYEPVIYGLYDAMQKVGIPITLFQFCTAQGILSSFLLMYLAGYLMLTHGIPSRWAALALTIWAGSYVVWHCSTLPDLSRNVLALLILTGAFCVISISHTKSCNGWPILAGFFIGLAGLFHSLTVFAVPSLGYFLWKRADKSRRASTFMTVTLVSAVTVISCYAFAILFLGQIQDIQGFLRWFSAPGGDEWWQFHLLRAGLDFVLTAIRALLGTVTYQPLKGAVLSAGRDHTATLLFGLLSAAILSYWGFIIISGIIRPSKPLTVIGQAMLLWLICYLPIAFFFDKWDVRVLLYLSIPVALLTAECASQRNVRRHQIAGLITALLVFIVNGSTIMYKESKPETQRAYQLLESMNALSHDPGDLFLVSMGTDAQYAVYFGKRRAIPLRVVETDFSALRFELSDVTKTGKRLFIETDLFDMIVNRRHPSRAVLSELIDLNAHSTRGSEDREFKLIQRTSSR
jgi:hypothetical protein